MSNIKIYNDSLHEGLWFQDLCPNLLKDAQLVKIKNRGENPSIIDELISYDRPDIILTSDDIPKLVIEKTTEVPSGHNVGQRVGRIVKAAECLVPAIYFLPFDARKHGAYTSICNLNIRLLNAMLNMTRIHEVPIVAMNWIADNNGELIRDGSQDLELAKLLEDYILNKYNPIIKNFNNQIELMQKEYDLRLKKFENYGKPPNSVKIIPTKLFLNQNSNEVLGFENEIIKNKNTLVYTINMSPDKCRREDPYTGTQFIYDYQHCRIGKNAAEKSKNLVLNIPKVTKKIWLKNNPNDESRKSCLWYKAANLILLKDGIIHLR